MLVIPEDILRNNTLPGLVYLKQDLALLAPDYEVMLPYQHDNIRSYTKLPDDGFRSKRRNLLISFQIVKNPMFLCAFTALSVLAILFQNRTLLSSCSAKP